LIKSDVIYEINAIIVIITCIFPYLIIAITVCDIDPVRYIAAALIFLYIIAIAAVKSDTVVIPRAKIAYYLNFTISNKDTAIFIVFATVSKQVIIAAVIYNVDPVVIVITFIPDQRVLAIIVRKINTVTLIIIASVHHKIIIAAIIDIYANTIIIASIKFYLIAIAAVRDTDAHAAVITAIVGLYFIIAAAVK